MKLLLVPIMIALLAVPALAQDTVVVQGTNLRVSVPPIPMVIPIQKVQSARPTYLVNIADVNTFHTNRWRLHRDLTTLRPVQYQTRQQYTRNLAPVWTADNAGYYAQKSCGGRHVVLMNQRPLVRWG